MRHAKRRLTGLASFGVVLATTSGCARPDVLTREAPAPAETVLALGVVEHHRATDGAGVAAAQGSRSFGSDMRLVHELLANHEAIRRTVTNLPDGIRTVTESDDPRVAQYLRDHVSSMNQRLRDGDVFNVASPNLPTIFQNADRIHTEIQPTATGVILTQTSDDPATVAALQAHAAEVSELAEEGMVAMMRGMMENGGPMGGGMHGMGGRMHRMTPGGPAGGLHGGSSRPEEHRR